MKYEIETDANVYRLTTIMLATTTLQMGECGGTILQLRYKRTSKSGVR